MDNLFKNFIYTGVGLIAMTKDKFQKTIDDLVSDDRISSKEGKKLVDDFLKTTNSKKDELETQMKNVMEKTITTFRFASSKELDALKNRVAVLEAVIASREKALEENK